MGRTPLFLLPLPILRTHQYCLPFLRPLPLSARHAGAGPCTQMPGCLRHTSTHTHKPPGPAPRFVTFDGIAKACAEAGGFPEPELVHYNPKDYDFGKAKVERAGGTAGREGRAGRGAGQGDGRGDCPVIGA